MDRNEFWEGLHSPKLLHGPFSSSEGEVAIFGPIVEPAASLLEFTFYTARHLIRQPKPKDFRAAIHQVLVARDVRLEFEGAQAFLNRSR